MKTLKLFNHFLTFIMVLTVIVFNSCSKDEEPETGEQPTEDAAGRRLVSKMEYSSPEDGDWVVQFFYNKDGSLQKVTNDEDELKEVTLIRTGNGLNLKLDYEEVINSEVVNTTDNITCKLNKDGYVISSLYEGKDRYSYEYQNGFLSRARYSDTFQWNATWQNGDIVKVADDDRTTNYTYTNQENKMNIEIFDITYPELFEDNELCMTSGYWGKRNKHLLKKAETIGPQGRESSYEFSYESDPKGYVTQILYTMKEWWKNGSEPRTWTATITVIYID